MQQNFSWANHLERGNKAILPGIRRQFGALQQLSKQLPRASKKLLSEGLLLSRLSYMITQWGGATENFITTAQRLENKLANGLLDAKGKPEFPAY